MGTQINTHQSSYLLLQLPSNFTHIKSNPFPPKFPINHSKTLILKPILSSFSNSSSSSSSSTNNKEQKWVHEGTISESLPNGMFWVNCDNGEVILGYVSGKMRRGSIRILPGDRVKVEVSRYDSARGRIIYRTRG